MFLKRKNKQSRRERGEVFKNTFEIVIMVVFVL